MFCSIGRSCHPESRRPWLIARYGAIGFIIMWLIVEGPAMYRLIFEGGVE